MEDLLLEQPDGSPRRSTFVTVLSWLYIVLSGFNAVMAAFQNVTWRLATGGTPSFEAPGSGAPTLAIWLFGHFGWLLAGYLLAPLVILVAAIGLLRRRNWARVFFIVTHVLVVLWTVGWLLWLLGMFISGPPMSHLPMALVVLHLMFFAFGSGLCVVNLWITKRLISPSITLEFGKH